MLCTEHSSNAKSDVLCLATFDHLDDRRWCIWKSLKCEMLSEQEFYYGLGCNIIQWKIVSEIHRWKAKNQCWMLQAGNIGYTYIATRWQVASQKELNISARFCTVTPIQNNTGTVPCQLSGVFQSRKLATFSIDLNSLYYCNWGILKSKVNIKQRRYLNSLKAFLLR